VEIMAVLQVLNQRGLTVVLVTHEPDIAAYARRQIHFRDGRVVGDEAVAQPRAALAELHVTPSTAEPAANGRVEIREEQA
jgi:putative ABC transport system ATP-binding protein